jgi:hypothetical protein
METLALESQEMRKHRLCWWTLGVLCLSVLVVVIDSSVLKVALPTLQRELGAFEIGDEQAQPGVAGVYYVLEG